MPQKKKSKIGIDFLGSDNSVEVFLEAISLASLNADIVAFVTPQMAEKVSKWVFSCIVTEEII